MKRDTDISREASLIWNTAIDMVRVRSRSTLQASFGKLVNTMENLT